MSSYRLKPATHRDKYNCFGAIVAFKFNLKRWLVKKGFKR
jgi:hypothetical protein